MKELTVILEAMKLIEHIENITEHCNWQRFSKSYYKSTTSKNQNRQMRCHQTKKLLQSKNNNQQYKI